MGDFVDRKLGDLTIRIDRERCIGSGNCIKAEGDVFEFDDTSVCAFRATIPEVERERLIEACRVCPVAALIVIDAGGGQLVP